MRLRSHTWTVRLFCGENFVRGLGKHLDFRVHEHFPEFFHICFLKILMSVAVMVGRWYYSPLLFSLLISFTFFYWSVVVFIPTPKKGNAKECTNYHTVALISHASKVMLKILQGSLQQYMNCELPDVQASLEKAEEPEIKLPTSAGSLKK